MTDIAVFLPSCGGGGAERAMITLANAFARKGYKVDLVLALAKGPYLAEVSADVILPTPAGHPVKRISYATEVSHDQTSYQEEGCPQTIHA